VIEDARQLEADARLDCDLCIVGAGAAGIAMADALRNTGMRVCLLESGGLRKRAESQALATAERDGHPYFPIHETRLRRLGGTTGWWSGACRPLDPVDLEPRPWLGLAGWPIAIEELAVWYAQAQRLCELGPEPFDPAEPWLQRAGTAPLPLDRGRFVTQIFRYSPPTDFGHTYLPRLRDTADLRVLLHATAIAIEVDPQQGRATGVRVRPLLDREIVIGAGLVVLAAGGIENARLLLASGPQGLANDHDQVGRCFMEHLFFDDVARLEPDGAWPQLRLYGRQTRLVDGPIQATLAPTAAVQRQAHLLNCCIKLTHPAKRQPGLVAITELRDHLRTGLAPAHVGRALRTMVTDAVGTIGALAWLGIEQRRGWQCGDRRLLVSVTSEQAPNPDSRVTLSERRDRLGQRLARLDWRLGQADQTTWLRALEQLARDLVAAGIGRLILPGPAEREVALKRVRGGRHHMGTTRMADRPEDGVVDRDTRVHGIDNLYIAGSSVFPSGGHANPTLTLLALALRLADHLASRRP
jgi:choline dehydrogenase-like flavoprotein